MTAAQETQSQGLQLAGVIERTFAMLGRRPATLFGLGLLLGGLATAISASTPKLPPAVMLTSPVFWFAFAVALFLRTLLAACVFAAVSAELQGEGGALDHALSRGVAACLPLLALTVLAYLGIGIGLLLLIVPGVILALAWSLAGPALVVEGSGIFAAFGASDRLTRNHRLEILALFLVFAIAAAALQALGAGLRLSLSQPTGSPLAIALKVLVSAVQDPVAYVGLAVLYFEARRLKDGSAPFGAARGP